MTVKTVPFALFITGAIRRCELTTLPLAISHAMGVLRTPVSCDVILGSVVQAVCSLPNGACKAAQGSFKDDESNFYWF